MSYANNRSDEETNEHAPLFYSLLPYGHAACSGMIGDFLSPSTCL